MSEQQTEDQNQGDESSEPSTGSDAGATPSKAKGKAGAKAPAGSLSIGQTDAPRQAPAWQQTDYNGPLTIDQVDWRRAHLKPTAAPARK